MKYHNQLSVGYDLNKHRGVDLPNVIGNYTYDEFVTRLNELYTYKIVFVVPDVEHRPDLISNAFYGTPNLDWLILLVNNIADPFEGLNAGDRIRLPVL